MITYRPTVVIGLGGTGKTVLLSLKKMIAENSPNGMKDFPFLRFLSFDTDVDVPKMTSSIEALNAEELSLDPVREVFSLGSNWNNRPQLDQFPEIQSWFPPAFQHKLVASDFRMGAGQSKPLGRFALAWSANDAYAKLQSQMSGIVTIVNQGNVAQSQIDKGLNVFLCGSICGGTGAGTFIDLAYMVRHIATGMAVDLFLYGMFALSSLFDQMPGAHNIKANCYASLLELDYFMAKENYENPLRNYRPAFNNFSQAGQYAVIAQNRVFDYPFLFDSTNEKNIALGGAGDLAEMMARFIYLLTGSEASNAYKSVDSNITNNHDTNYRNLLRKPIRYRTMGTYSIVFPKRMVRQLLGYTLTSEILKILLDDSYQPVMVKNLSERFLKDYGFHPGGNLQDRLKSYVPGGSPSLPWVDHVQSEWEALVSGDGSLLEAPVGEWAGRIKDLIAGLERDFEEYKSQNIVANRKACDEFGRSLDGFLQTLLDLRLKEDLSNNKTPARGSLRRAADVLAVLVSDFNAARQLFKDRQSKASGAIRDSRDGVDSIRQDLQDMTKGILGVKARAKKSLEELGRSLTDYFTARQDEFIGDQLFQLVDGQHNTIRDERGLIALLEERAKAFQILVSHLVESKKTADAMLVQNRNFKTGDLVQALFNFDRDVTQIFSEVWSHPDKGREYILGDLGDRLRADSGFGPSYQKAWTMSQETFLKRILRLSEDVFTTTVDAVNIEDRILEDDRICAAFRGKNYHGNANLFLKIDNTAMSREGINRESNQFYSVTIPGTKYVGKPCSSTKGDLQKLERKCPVDADTTNSLTCPIHMKCLKQILLPTLDEYTALVETENNGEINFFKTLVGYPLHALSTATNCRGLYEQQKDLDRQAGRKGETLHMFGEVSFPSVFDPTEDIDVRLRQFRNKLVLGSALRVVVLQPLSIDFFTTEDNQFMRESPSLHLGDGLEDALRRSQSNRIRDVEATDQFVRELDIYIARVLQDAEQKSKTLPRLEKAYEDLKKKDRSSPLGIFAPEDADVLRAFVLEQYKKDLQPPTTLGTFR